MTTKKKAPAKKIDTTNRGVHVKTAPYEIFTSTAEVLGINHFELNALLGYAKTANNIWMKKGEMPYVASLACDQLVSIAQGDAKPNKKFFVSIELTEIGQINNLKQVLNFSGVKYKIMEL